MHLRPPRSRTGTIMRSREGGMQRGDRPGEGDAELLELPDVNTCRLVQSGLVSCVNTSTQHFNPATAVCMQRAHWVARAACVVGADTAHTESFRLWRNNRIAPQPSHQTWSQGGPLSTKLKSAETPSSSKFVGRAWSMRCPRMWRLRAADQDGYSAWRHTPAREATLLRHPHSLPL